MQVEVTDADRDAAARFYERIDKPTSLRCVNARLGRMDDLPTVQAFARHREAARIEGIRLGLEAAAGVADEWQSSLKPGSIDRLNGHREARKDIGTAIRAIDPAVIGAGQLPQRVDSGRHSKCEPT